MCSRISLSFFGFVRTVFTFSSLNLNLYCQLLKRKYFCFSFASFCSSCFHWEFWTVLSFHRRRHLLWLVLIFIWFQLGVSRCVYLPNELFSAMSNRHCVCVNEPLWVCVPDVVHNTVQTSFFVHMKCSALILIPFFTFTLNFSIFYLCLGII